MNRYVRLSLVVIFSALALLGLATISERLSNAMTTISLRAVTSNMGDQIAIHNDLRFLQVAQVGLWAIGLGLVFLTWLTLYREQIKSFIAIVLGVLAVTVLAGCNGTSPTVIVTPPDYAIVISSAAPSNQAIGNDFGNGDLVNVTQIPVWVGKCPQIGNAAATWDCPDKLVATVQGSPESRIYTLDPTTGTAGANQALQFEAQGANGSLDFSINAIIKREDAKCYANKMGVKPKVDTKTNTASRYEYRATSLADALDNRVIQIAGAEFAKAVKDISPIDLAEKKFDLFESVKPRIIALVHEQTCVTVNDMAINGGVVWGSKAVQDTIDDAIVTRNRQQLAAMQNELDLTLANGLIARTKAYSEAFGLEAALDLARTAKWDGSALPLFNFGLPTNTQTVSGTVKTR